jgi:hypothetical protein
LGYFFRWIFLNEKNRLTEKKNRPKNSLGTWLRIPSFERFYYARGHYPGSLQSNATFILNGGFLKNEQLEKKNFREEIFFLTIANILVFIGFFLFRAARSSSKVLSGSRNLIVSQERAINQKKKIF